jgi:hypothetical protein
MKLSMLEFSEEEISLYKALTDLAYTLASLHQPLDATQMDIFGQTIQNTLGEGEWMVLDSFVFKPHQDDLENIYKQVIEQVENNKKALTGVVITKFIYILEKISEVMKVSNEDKKVIDRFESDLIRINTYKSDRHHKMKMTPARINLYSTIGQLGYVIAMADNILMDAEIEVFRAVLKEHLGEFDWLAEDRFKVIEELKVSDLESTYEHAMYLIKRNREALTEDMIQTFLDVIVEIAKVAGFTPEELDVIQRFDDDIRRIYEG